MARSVVVSYVVVVLPLPLDLSIGPSLDVPCLLPGLSVSLSLCVSLGLCVSPGVPKVGWLARVLSDYVETHALTHPLLLHPILALRSHGVDGGSTVYW
jgi:hypothetical protein